PIDENEVPQGPTDPEKPKEPETPKEPEKPVLPGEGTPPVDEPIKEDPIPQGKPELPKTSGVASSLFRLLGGGLLGLGVAMKRKKKK
ncbi:MAG: LPXTG cell wall anchor domain-containing protein, partial [Eubacteriales bacterium]|nr:LPXTG cell wall anchor domain-containing protein [Eubacteriales bacterium]